VVPPDDVLSFPATHPLRMFWCWSAVGEDKCVFVVVYPIEAARVRLPVLGRNFYFVAPIVGFCNRIPVTYVHICENLAESSIILIRVIGMLSVDGLRAIPTLLTRGLTIARSVSSIVSALGVDCICMEIH